MGETMKKGVRANQQKGAALAVSLVILLIMTIIGLQGISSTTLEERMSRNYRDSQLSFQAAETALRDGEAFVESTLFDLSDYTSACVNGLCFNGTSGACPVLNPSTPLWEDSANVWNNSANHKVYSGTITGAFAQPKYIVEFQCYAPTDPSAPVPSSPEGSTSEWSEMYRITALGFGASDTSRTMLQSTYKKLL